MPCYQALQDQYRAVNLSFAVSHECRALKFLRRPGWSFFMDMFWSPNLTIFISLPFFARTALFFAFPGVLFGLLNPANVSPLYFMRPDGVLVTSLVVAISNLSYKTPLRLSRLSKQQNNHPGTTCPRLERKRCHQCYPQKLMSGK